MPTAEPFYKSAAGVQHLWQNNGDGSYTVASVQDCTEILDANKRLANFNNGYSPSKELRRAATIPLIVWMKWLQEEGWDAFDPECERKLTAKLNDPEWRYLRTADFTV